MKNYWLDKLRIFFSKHVYDDILCKFMLDCTEVHVEEARDFTYSNGILLLRIMTKTKMNQGAPTWIPNTLVLSSGRDVLTINLIRFSILPIDSHDVLFKLINFSYK